MTDFLFDPGEAPSPDPMAAEPSDSAGRGKPRLRVPVRNQVVVRAAALDELLPPDHPARMVWQAVSRLDLSPWLDAIEAVEGTVGRNATDPRLLLALWIYATIDGEGSAREIARLSKEHIVYQWLCGEVTINHHTLSDFRSQGAERFDTLFAELIAGLLAENLVTLCQVAQDGMRVRASAGKSSFRRQATLQECLVKAREQVEAVKRQADANPQEINRRQQAARERAARERLARVEAALANCAELAAQRDKRAKVACEPAKEARASTTDPEARTMKFPNGGFGPGYNVQFMTDVSSGLVIGVDVTNAGSDGEQLPPMLDQVKARCGKDPEAVLVDGGFATKDAITDAADEHGCTVYAPLKDEAKQRAQGKDPHAAKRGDTKAVSDLRQRMASELAKAIYKLRAQTAEWVNAQCRNRGLWQMPVRGRPKCRMVALFYAMAHNLVQAAGLRAAKADRRVQSVLKAA